MTRSDVIETLKQANIEPARVLLHRNGQYVIDFHKPEWAAAVEPAAVYAAQIAAALPGIKIIETCNTVAPWRQGQPVVNAMVVFEVTRDV